MSERSPLPFPILMDLGSQACLACGYSLDGLPAPGECPECGLEFDEGLSALMIHGVPKTVGGPRWRKVVWGIIVGCAFVYAQIMILFVQVNPIAAGAVFLAIVAASVGMAVTNRQKKTGTEIIVFSRFGIGHWPKSKKEKREHDRIFSPWQGVKIGATIKQISSVWLRLKIRSIDEKGKHTIVFDTGFRCQAADIPVITQIINRLAEGQWIDDIDGIELIGTRDAGLEEGQGFYIIEKPSDDDEAQMNTQGSND